MLLSKLNHIKKHRFTQNIKIPKYMSLKRQEIIEKPLLKAPMNTIHSTVITPTIITNIVWKPTKEVNIPVNALENDSIKKVDTLGFIILRNVINPMTNEYWKECFRCIRRFYPTNRVLIIDDNSKKQFVTNDALNNTMIIESEFPKRGEFLPYYYYLRTNFCDKVVILHDSMFIKKYINFAILVNDYKFLIHFGKNNINDLGCFPSQLNILRALNSFTLNNFYNKKDQDSWSGCFGSMSVITYNYLKEIDEEFRLMQLIPVITKRIDRCAFERIIGCILQYKHKNSSLMGHTSLNCDWGINFNKYKKNMYNFRLPIIKVFTGR